MQTRKQRGPRLHRPHRAPAKPQSTTESAPARRAKPKRPKPAPGPQDAASKPRAEADGVPSPPDWASLPASRVSAAALDAFRIPPFLLPIYQAAGIEYGVRWEVPAAINEIETDDSRKLNVSSAGALGWMQFMPASSAQWGTDANRDGLRDPYNPVDAIFAAARYLRAAGADTASRERCSPTTTPTGTSTKCYAARRRSPRCPPRWSAR